VRLGRYLRESNDWHKIVVVLVEVEFDAVRTVYPLEKYCRLIFQELF
jgi:hypothetical protein